MKTVTKFIYALSAMFALACFALSPTVRAVDPPPDGSDLNGNTAEGTDALVSLVGGLDNTAIGFQALFNDTVGHDNTAAGWRALLSNTTGGGNTATGFEALVNNTTGYYNTANGAYALLGWRSATSNYSGSYNTATGVGALQNNYTGNGNTATGVNALAGAANFGHTGNNNTANGIGALFNNTDGSLNVANGASALKNNTSGNKNTASGFNALVANRTGTGNTAEGDGALGGNTGSFNTAVGHNAGGGLTTGSDNVDIQASGVAGESNTMRIGTIKQKATFISGIRGTATANANAVPVVIDSAGQLGTMSSSRRFKDEIKPMDNASDAILGLEPVTFHYKSDTQNTPQFGLIAEEVAKVNPDLVVRDDKGEIYTVRYEAVNAMLLNEFLKEHRRVEEQGVTIAQQKKDFASQLARQQKAFEAKFAQQQQQVEALTATVQKVSNQIALDKPAPQLVANP